VQFLPIVAAGDCEKIFGQFQNVRGSAFAAGDAVVLDSGASVDGARVTVAATATLSLFIGVCTTAIANSAYGQVQVYGFCSVANVLNDITTAQTVGNLLLPANGAVTLGGASGSVVSDGKSGYVYALEVFTTQTTPIALPKKVFIRAM